MGNARLLAELNPSGSTKNAESSSGNLSCSETRKRYTSSELPIVCQSNPFTASNSSDKARSAVCITASACPASASVVELSRSFAVCRIMARLYQAAAANSSSGTSNDASSQAGSENFRRVLAGRDSVIARRNFLIRTDAKRQRTDDLTPPWLPRGQGWSRWRDDPSNDNRCGASCASSSQSSSPRKRGPRPRNRPNPPGPPLPRG